MLAEAILLATIFLEEKPDVMNSWSNVAAAAI